MTRCVGMNSAEEIATCLSALHAIEPSAFPDGSLVRIDPLEALTALTRQTKPWLRDRLDTNQQGTLDVLLDEAFGVLPGRPRAVCHADPWFGNMLLDDVGRLVALLDWEGLCLADPAYDLAALTYLDPPSADADDRRLSRSRAARSTTSMSASARTACSANSGASPMRSVTT